jgi:HD-GYP domain-containing protein (c-di-GMP phosphodiesterase class II)
VVIRVAAPGSTPGATELVSPDRLAEARQAFTAFRGDARKGLEPLSGMVWGLIDGLTNASRELLPLAPLKDYDEYTFVHSVNVSLLTLAQARSLGIADEALHDVGLAALLHDFGKLKVPLQVLNKPGKLEGAEWELMTSHPELGARELSRLDGIRPLSIVVAYEHHMRFDGEPSYPLPRQPRRPGLASQLTSISDVYDAICTTRPYSKARPRTVALDVLRQRSGTFHDPALLDNFARIVLASEAAPPAAGKQANA